MSSTEIVSALIFICLTASQVCLLMALTHLRAALNKQIQVNETVQKQIATLVNANSGQSDVNVALAEGFESTRRLATECARHLQQILEKCR
jgi:hypothetical protein